MQSVTYVRRQDAWATMKWRPPELCHLCKITSHMLECTPALAPPDPLQRR